MVADLALETGRTVIISTHNLAEAQASVTAGGWTTIASTFRPSSCVRGRHRDLRGMTIPARAEPHEHRPVLAARAQLAHEPAPIDLHPISHHCPPNPDPSNRNEHRTRRPSADHSADGAGRHQSRTSPDRSGASGPPMGSLTTAPLAQPHPHEGDAWPSSHRRGVTGHRPLSPGDPGDARVRQRRADACSPRPPSWSA
jgi:hypothetical protein